MFLCLLARCVLNTHVVCIPAAIATNPDGLRHNIRAMDKPVQSEARGNEMNSWQWFSHCSPSKPTRVTTEELFSNAASLGAKAEHLTWALSVGRTNEWTYFLIPQVSEVFHPWRFTNLPLPKLLLLTISEAALLHKHCLVEKMVLSCKNDPKTTY